MDDNLLTLSSIESGGVMLPPTSYSESLAGVLLSGRGDMNSRLLVWSPYTCESKGSMERVRTQVDEDCWRGLVVGQLSSAVGSLDGGDY